MSRNPMAHREPAGFIPREGPSGDLRNKRRSIQIAFEMHGMTRIEEMRKLKGAELEDFIRDIEFFEKNPNIPTEEIVKYYREKSELTATIADVIEEKGR